MPAYDFKCKKCDSILENVILGIMHTKGERPKCCGETMAQHFTVPPSVYWVDPVIEPFRPIARGRNEEPITTTRQRREYMARNDLVDSNDLGPPPTYKDDLAVHARVQDSIEAISPDEDTSAKMEQQGLMDPNFSID